MSDRGRAIPPGATLGILGGGQLGRMLALAARRLGYRVRVFSPEADAPAGQIADAQVTAPYDDLDAVAAFARGVDVVTFEFENVSFASADAAARWVPVRPSALVLHTCQHRVREKSFLQAAGLPLTPFRPVASLAELRAALADLGSPAVLKTADFGYDGKGQCRIERPQDAAAAWEAIGRPRAVLEQWVALECEISVVAARGVGGEFAHFGAVENAHRHHILDTTLAPARVPPAVAAEAVEITRCVFEKLDLVGVACVEFFRTARGDLWINEIAPRPHNSGHFTLDACRTSQFEQQLRAVCGLALGSPEQLRPAAMANLLGDLWAGGEPDWPALCAHREVKLHLYGKSAPRPGRKMGHITALAADAAGALRAVAAARAALVAPAPPRRAPVMSRKK